jgi:Rieske Fe-S protein
MTTTDTLHQNDLGRREFCTRACHLASLAAIGGLLSHCGGGPTAPGDLGTPLPTVSANRVNGVITLTIDAGSPLAAVGGAALVQSAGADFLVTRTAQDACTVLTALCTHQACTITGFSNAIYICPCHGSEFDTAGHVVRGPAQAALHQFPSQLGNGVLTISA